MASSDTSIQSIGSNYTGTSIHEMKDFSPTKGVVGKDPRSEKEELFSKVVLRGEEVLVGDYYSKTILKKRLAGGSFGEVYLGELLEKGLEVAVKLEPQNTWIQPTLMNEGKIYRKMGFNLDRVPHLYWFGFYGNNNAYAAMVMDLLGDSLYNIWVKQGQELSLKSILMLVEESLECLENIHSRGCLHRDISPNNFAIATVKPNEEPMETGEETDEKRKEKLFIFDFGHAEILSPQQQIFFRSPKQHLSINKTRVVGTPRFASVFNHLGNPPSFRDDMDSLGYVWIYLIKGRLPWQGVKTEKQQDRLDVIGKKKLETPIPVLCDRLPNEFVDYFNYVRKLGHLQKPDYKAIKLMFRALGGKMGINYDWVYDWHVDK